MSPKGESRPLAAVLRPLHAGELSHPEREHTLTDTVSAYIAAKERDEGAITFCQVGSINKELNLLKKHFVGEMVSALTAQRLTAYCERGKPSLKTMNNRRSILGTFFRFAFQKDWIATNLIESAPRYRLKRGSAPTITAVQAKALMEFVEGYERGRLVPFFALCLFASIRPCVRNGEISSCGPNTCGLPRASSSFRPRYRRCRKSAPSRFSLTRRMAWLRA